MNSPWMCVYGQDGQPECVDLGPGKGVYATQADCEAQCMGYWLGLPRWVFYAVGAALLVVGLLVALGVYELVRHAPQSALG